MEVKVKSNLKILTALGVGFLGCFLLGGSGQSQQATPRLLSDTAPRFQIVMRNDVRADTFLLDTQMGRVWARTQFTDLASQPEVWICEDRIDDQQGLDQLIQRLGPVPAEKK